MEQKEDLEDLVGACAIMNKFKVNQMKERSFYFLSLRRKNWPHGAEGGSVEARECTVMNIRGSKGKGGKLLDVRTSI